MEALSAGEIGGLLDAAASGDEAASARAFESLEPMLRSIAANEMRNERPDHTLQTTILVDEAFVALLRSVETTPGGVRALAGFAGEVMRNVLRDHARSKNRLKRGGGAQPRSLIADPEGEAALDVIELDEALERLRARDSELSFIVRCRIYLGLPFTEIARMLAQPKSNVYDRWRFAIASIRMDLRGGADA